jgi:Zn finger protein HypA/HybF involved in hydrogenase expression
VKSRTKLLGILALLPLALAPLTGANSEEVAEESASAATEAAGEDTAPPPERRRSSIMGELLFDHEMHAEEMELECGECHHETNAVPLGFPHEQYFDNFWIDCGTCHHEVGSPSLEARSCHDCHDAKLRDIADERLSPKVILHQNCWTCHEVETGVEASESCELCHSG